VDTKILTTTARLDDPAAMAAFLSPIPNGGELGKVLAAGEPVSTRAYDDETWTARFVESDGERVICFAVTNITIDQAEMITTEWEVVCTLDEADFTKAVERALHESIGGTN
jgi:hypothetical protein